MWYIQEAATGDKHCCPCVQVYLNLSVQQQNPAANCLQLLWPRPLNKHCPARQSTPCKTSNGSCLLPHTTLTDRKLPCTHNDKHMTRTHDRAAAFMETQVGLLAIRWHPTYEDASHTMLKNPELNWLDGLTVASASHTLVEPRGRQSAAANPKPNMYTRVVLMHDKSAHWHYHNDRRGADIQRACKTRARGLLQCNDTNQLCGHIQQCGG